MGLPPAEAATFPEAVEAYAAGAAEIDDEGVRAFVSAAGLLANREGLRRVQTLNVGIVGARLATNPNLYEGVVDDPTDPTMKPLMSPAAAIRAASGLYFRDVPMGHAASVSAVLGLRPDQRRDQATAMVGLGGLSMRLLRISDQEVTKRMGFDEFGLDPAPALYAFSLFDTIDGDAAFLEEMIGETNPDGVLTRLKTGRGRFWELGSMEARGLAARFKGVVAVGLHTSLETMDMLGTMAQ